MDDYWSTDPVLSHSWFHIVMSRNRFRQILRYIHVADNSTSPKRTDSDYDKLWKIRPLIDVLHVQKELHSEVSIDESMIGTKCRLSFIQYMPQKPTKWGIKVWVCCDAVNGYIYTFDVYTGALSSGRTYANGLAYKVVMKLMTPLFSNWYSLYMDNFYTSPTLKDLLDLKASGTVRQNN